MTYADLEKARQCHAALREIFIHHAGGWADKDALYKVEKLAWQAMTAVKDPECQEKMGIVEHYAAALYSESEQVAHGLAAGLRFPAPADSESTGGVQWPAARHRSGAAQRHRPRSTAASRRRCAARSQADRVKL
jgi:hypothetical protein